MQQRHLPNCLLLGLFVCLFCSKPSAEAANLVGHWKLNETSGTIATDSSALGNNGTHVNSPLPGQVGPYPGDLGTALQFNGTSNYVVITDDSAYSSHVSTGITVAAWVKVLAFNTDGYSQTRQPIVSKGTIGDWEWALYVYDYGAAGFSVWQQGGSSHTEISGGNLTVGSWAHVAATFEGGVANRVYINGQEVALGTTFTGSANDGVSNVRIASRTDGQYLNADISDVRIYSQPLTAAEIAALYEGLVGHWKMNEGSGTTAADATASANNATLNGATWAGSYAGNVLAFDGTGDTAATNTAFTPPATGSVAFWMQASGTPSVRQRIFGVNGNWEARLETTGKISFDLGASPYVGNEPFATGIVDEQGRWYHIVAMFNDVDNSYSVYVDGQLQASGISPVNLVPQSAGILSFGTRTGSSEFWKGSLRDFRVYSRWLSGVEVAELYGLVGHWKMDEGAGTTAADSTAFANDATLAGATWTTDCAGNNGLEFDGLGDTAATNSVFDPPENGAIAVWLRSAGNPGARSRPFGLGGNWEIRQEPDGTLSFDLGGEGPDVGAGPDAFITTEGLSFVDRWYHLVAQFKADDDSFEVYINGELVNSGVNGDNMVKQLANTLTFGTRTGNTEYWAGALRDFRVYNRWLAGSEISDLSGLAGYWKLDETSGTVAVDSSTNGNDGTYTGGVLLNQSGQVNQAADFDGIDDYVSVADDTSLQMDDVFSVSMWIRVDESTNVNQMILNKEGEYEIAIFPGGEIYWGIKNTNPDWSWHATGHVVAIGKWTHVAMTYDNGTVNTYANGVLVDTYNGSGVVGDQYTSLNELRIGGRSNNPSGKYFDGRIDDVRVFSRVMCPEEVFGQYKGSRPAGVRILQWVEVR